MAAWNNCRMTTLYIDDSGDLDRCDVRIDDKEIYVSYQDQDGTSVIYRGRDHGNGHFELKMDGGGGHASLHKFSGGIILEGWWTEEGLGEGAWRIELPLKK